MNHVLKFDMNENIEKYLNNGKIIFEKNISAKSAEYVGFPKNLNVEIVKLLKSMEKKSY